MHAQNHHPHHININDNPINNQQCPQQDDWLAKVCPLIAARIERYAASEIRFNLMAVVGDRQVRGQ